MYNSDGYVMIDMKDVNMSQSSQHISGIYNRVVSVIDTNKLALIINAGSNTPMAAVVHKRLNYYVINTTLYIFTINSNDIVIIEEAGTATVDVEIVPTLTEGVKVADFAIGAVEGSIYAPAQQSEINDNVTATNTTWSSSKIADELSGKANSADVYTKAQVDTALSAKADSADVYTKAQVDTALSAKADSADVYTKAQVDTALSAKADSADVYTKSQVDTALSGKQNKAWTSITIPTPTIDPNNANKRIYTFTNLNSTDDFFVQIRISNYGIFDGRITKATQYFLYADDGFKWSGKVNIFPSTNTIEVITNSNSYTPASYPLVLDSLMVR